MKERIDIIIDEARIAENDACNERLRRTRNFEPTDRTPVQINTNQWTGLAARGVTFAQYIRSPKDNLREQILNRKWRLENIKDDNPIPTKSLGFGPDLGCLRGTEFDMDVVFPENQPPKAQHPLTSSEQIDALSIPKPDNSINGKRLEFFHGMRDCQDDFDVRLNGDPLAINIGIGQPGGPMPSAFALAGSNLFLWMAMEPDRVHRLMDIVTESQLQCIRFFDDLMGRDPNHGTGIGYDTSEMLSLAMFQAFVVPYANRIYEAYPGHRGLHNCGKNEHLLDCMRDDLRINAHNGFGFCVDPTVLAEKMSGRVVLQGGPNPVLIKSGTPAEIKAECRRYIDIVGAKGGFILGLGGGAAANTPLENFQAMVDAAAVQMGPA